ncbi:MAG: hypothetical protein KAW56_00625 [Candidatus Marinimicrobia bacterium]|nr:hypothetical protein [Candidatus Neomarinimicrobiota bacterium]
MGAKKKEEIVDIVDKVTENLKIMRVVIEGAASIVEEYSTDDRASGLLFGFSNLEDSVMKLVNCNR